MMVLKDPGLWVFALLCTLSTGVDESLIRAVLSHARYLCDDAFYDTGSKAADAQESENAEVLRSLLSDTYSSHLRSVPPSGSLSVRRPTVGAR